MCILGNLIILSLAELIKYTIGNWSTVCFLIIILYFTKNSGITGGILPALMFIWILMDDGVSISIFLLKETYKYLWYIAYILFSFVIILIFGVS